MCKRILSHFIAGPSLKKRKREKEKKRVRKREREREGAISAKIGKRISS